MARPEGLEPPTPRFEAWYSIQLSYGRVTGVAKCFAGGCRPSVHVIERDRGHSSRYTERP